jgi:hypothetical protein
MDGSVPPNDGEVVDAPVNMPDGSPPMCAAYGQTCTVNSDCCNTVPCTGGRCIIIVN